MRATGTLELYSFSRGRVLNFSVAASVGGRIVLAEVLDERRRRMAPAAGVT